MQKNLYIRVFINWELVSKGDSLPLLPLSCVSLVMMESIQKDTLSTESEDVLEVSPTFLHLCLQNLEVFILLENKC